MRQARKRAMRTPHSKVASQRESIEHCGMAVPSGNALYPFVKRFICDSNDNMLERVK